ncbi:MAG TPA: zinc-binding dehydrogenase [Kofleriaceae bacterium]|jgi:NADPH:quinone reductase-like Zn-dependent oxidoreductase
MQAITMRAHGGPEVLQLEELPMMDPGPGQVRVRIRAVALNHLDIWVRKGGPAFKLHFPHVLGSDIVGEIDAVGPGVVAAAGVSADVGTKVVVQPGTSCGRCAQCLGGHDNLCRDYRILGEHITGGYASHIVVSAQNLAPYPEKLSWAEASSVILPFITAWQMVVHKARVQPGDVVLVQGAGSGIGVAAIQIAKLYGAKVIATASTEEKLARAKQLGADEVINYTATDFVAAARGLTGKRGVDAVIEHVGGETFAGSIRAVRVGGRVVTCGATAGFNPAIDLRHIFFRSVEVLGSTMGSKADLLAVLQHVNAGTLKPIVDRVMPLAKAGDAHGVLEQRAAFGKVVLEP